MLLNYKNIKPLDAEKMKAITGGYANPQFCSTECTCENGQHIKIAVYCMSPIGCQTIPGEAVWCLTGGGNTTCQDACGGGTTPA